MSDRDSDSYFWTRQARDGGEFESPAAERDPEPCSLGGTNTPH